MAVATAVGMFEAVGCSGAYDAAPELLDVDAASNVDADLADAAPSFVEASRDSTTDATPPDCSAGKTCARVPPGWQAAVSTTGPCPAGFALRRPLLTGVTAGPAACTCNCSGTQGCTATFTLNKYVGGGCATLRNTRTISTRPTCGGGGGTIIAADSYNVSNVVNGLTPASCGASAALTSKPVPVEQTTSLCQPSATCAAGACVPPESVATMCIVKAGAQVCPPGFPKRTVMALTLTDTRGCGPCVCGSTLQCALTGALITNSNICGATPYQLTAAGSACVPGTAPSDYPLNGNMGTFSSIGSGACAQTSPSTPTGGVSLSTATTETSCCP